MTKELVKQETKAVGAVVNNQSWGSEGVDASDVVIPKLLLMQGQSEFVASGKAKAGDIARSTTSEILGGSQKGVEIIPILSFKTWVNLEENGSRFEYRGAEPVTAANVNDPLEWVQGGKKWRRDKCLNFYVLLPQDIAREAAAMSNLEKTGAFPDPKDALLPCVLSFRRTSYGAGKTLSTHFIQAAHFHRPPAVSRFLLTSKMEKNDKGTFYIFEVANAGLTEEKDLDVCRRWYETITQTKVNVKVDDSHEKKEPKKKPEPAKAAPVMPDVDVDDMF